MTRRLHGLLAGIALAAVLAVCAAAGGQEAAPLPSPSTAPQERNTVPRLRIIYYVEQEGPGWKEHLHFNLSDWAPDKDVLITQSWGEEELVPLAGTRTLVFRKPRRYSEGLGAGRLSTWRIEYVDAGVENSSRLILRGFGRTFTSRIYGPDDRITLLKVPSLGWQELGLAARLARQYGAARQE